MSSTDPIPLLRELVRNPSISGNESLALLALADWFERRGLEYRLEGRNLVAETGPEGGPVLLVNAHLDTVPVGPGWTRDPFGGEIEGDRLYGRGANDNKASVAALACNFANHSRTKSPGRVVFAATCDEETGGEGLEWLLPRLPRIDEALVAEPTDFRVAVAQRGLVRVTALAHGRTAHASRPHEGVNAVDLALLDIGRLKAISLDREHPLLGRPTLEVTRIEGGTAANVLPGECRFTLDGRPTPEQDNDYFEREIRAALHHSEIETFRGRMTPVVMPEDSAVARAAFAATGHPEPTALGGVSDLFHVRHLPAVVVGPGTPDQSHAPDESVSVEAVRRAVPIYRRIVTAVLEELAP